MSKTYPVYVQHIYNVRFHFLRVWSLIPATPSVFAKVSSKRRWFPSFALEQVCCAGLIQHDCCVNCLINKVLPSRRAGVVNESLWNPQCPGQCPMHLTYSVCV